MTTRFKKLNYGWNADPNSPLPNAVVDKCSLRLSFLLNGYMYEYFNEEEPSFIDFLGVSKYRLGKTNDEGWYYGQCRFSRIAPAWGEFYKIDGDSLLERSPNDWVVINQEQMDESHYLFYFKDETFECFAKSWDLSKYTANKLIENRDRLTPAPHR